MPDDAAMRQVIQTFAGGEARLIVTDEAGGRRSVEVSHEALIRHWDKLRAWIDENRDKLADARVSQGEPRGMAQARPRPRPARLAEPATSRRREASTSSRATS